MGGDMTDSSARTMMAYDAQKKSTLIAYLLWWFLGYFGAHRFYLGRTGSAIAMLLLTLISFAGLIIFIGIFGLLAVGVWWLVDAFLIPGIVREHNMRLASMLG
jgi:TM2 domain-containing membrane protein YozV